MTNAQKQRKTNNDGKRHTQACMCGWNHFRCCGTGSSYKLCMTDACIICSQALSLLPPLVTGTKGARREREPGNEVDETYSPDLLFCP